MFDKMYDKRNAIVTISGDEKSSKFVGNLFNMYSNYLNEKDFQIETISSYEFSLGCYKELSFIVIGKGAYGKLKYESGIHKAIDELHILSVTVNVLPQVNDEVHVDSNEVKLDMYKTFSDGSKPLDRNALVVRATHMPSGAFVEYPKEKNQYINQDKISELLKLKLVNSRQSEDEIVRTYNFSKQTVNDNRVGLGTYNLDDVLNGNIDEIIGAFAT